MKKTGAFDPETGETDMQQATNKTRLRPLHDMVLIRRAEKDDMTRSGLHIPASAQDTNVKGEVIAVGPGKWGHNDQRLPMAVRVGDVVYCPKYGGQEISLDGEKYVLFHEDELHGKFTKED